MFIRQLKRRDESGHAVFHMQDSRKATQGYILVWNTGKRNAHTEKNRIEVRSFQRILKETCKLELYIYRNNLCIVNLIMRFFIRVRYPIFQTQYDVHYSTMRYQQYIVILDQRFEFIPCIFNAMKKLFWTFSVWP